MIPSLQAQLGFEPAEGPFDSRNSDDGGDDWVSLILTDVGADVEADYPISETSLRSLPLPDLDDLDFSNLNESGSSNGFSSSFERGPPSHADALFDPSEILQDMEMCPSLYHVQDKGSSGAYPYGCSQPEEMLACPSFAHFPTLANKNADSQSPESALSHGSSELPNADANIPMMDSCSEEDSFYFFVSDICSEETSSMEAKPLATGGSTEFCGCNRTCDIQGNTSTLQSSNNQQNFCTASDKNDTSTSKRDTSRKRKYVDRMSRSTTPEGVTVDCQHKPLEESEVKEEEEDERRKARLMRNRESAQLSRQRKKIYIDELEEKIKTMASTIAELNNTISLISAENINLRRQMGMFGPPPGQAGRVSPWMGAYPPGPMVGNGFMKPGAQVPLVPIPRWKSQQPTTVKKTRKPKGESQEKGGSEKLAKKTKKVAGVAAAGLFFFVFILPVFNFQHLGVRPIMQSESKVWLNTPWQGATSSGVVRAGGRVLMGLNDGSRFSPDEPGSGMASTALSGGEKLLKAGGDSQVLERCDTTDTNIGDHIPGYKRNASVPLAATLFVPRNDQLVRIEGNLIINSVLAGNKAADFLNQPNKPSVKDPAVYDRNSALNANLKAVALKAAPEEKGALVELQRALAGRLRFDLDRGDIKPVTDDDSLQQWFVEDFTGPIFSSGMCSEVFQFETSPASSSSTPGSGTRVRDVNDLVKNKTAWLQENGPRKAGRHVPYSGKPPTYAVPLPPVGHKVMYNATSTNNSFSGSQGGHGRDRDFAKQKHATSVVVSVLAGPELGENPKLTGGHKLSRIFVVVLIDSMKYVTYSCMLPSAATKPHYEVVVA